MLQISRLFFAFLQAFMLITYLLVNIKSGAEGTGHIYLMCALLCFIILYLLTQHIFSLRYVKKSLVLIVFFIFYSGYKVLFDTSDIFLLSQHLLGSTNGVFFAFLVGFLQLYSFAAIYFTVVGNGRLFSSFIFIVFIFFLFVLIMSNDILNFNISKVREDLFLIEDNKGMYQRPGSMILMVFISLSSFLAITNALVCYYNRFKFVFAIMVFMYVGIAILFMGLSQILGSNSGFVTVLGILAMFLTYLVICRLNYSYILNIKKLGVGKVIFSRIGYHILIMFTIAMALIGASLVYLLGLFQINIDKLRILSFGGGEVASFGSRFEILRGNFVEHWAYQPIWGHSQVEVFTSGPGTYVHSIVSILTHLGLIGFVLFLILMTTIYADIKRTKHEYRPDNLFTDNHFSLFRLFSVGTLLVFASFSAFYTWMPFWYTLGLLGQSLVISKSKGGT
ncbi:hypothetical protein [Pseudoalteromonas sp. MMG012]|uniref:hypothetical protein n=1 Tax=Pseudoalteromonas sp. MMG012 TaxID=2822686 RepID=UPI001B3A044F|nr:hypothetical protein [Pseudoalteromonas sp. MMG012]MBQ4849204.1 hypothetical protein [Pseudoalteromonas sp. MMG012]